MARLLSLWKENKTKLLSHIWFFIHRKIQWKEQDRCLVHPIFHFGFLVTLAMKILRNLCLHFARQDGQDRKKPRKKITQLKRQNHQKNRRQKYGMNEKSLTVVRDQNSVSVNGMGRKHRYQSQKNFCLNQNFYTFLPTSWGNTSFYKRENKPSPSKTKLKVSNVWRKIWF